MGEEGVMVSEDLETAVGNFVEVFKCEPKEQAKSQLRQMLEERKGTEAFPASLEVYKEDLKALRMANSDLQAKANRLAQTVVSLTQQAADNGDQLASLKQWNEKLKQTVQNQEKQLADERTQREMHEGNMTVVMEKLGKKTGMHNFMERIDELIEKEKATLKPKSKKK